MQRISFPSSLVVDDAPKTSHPSEVLTKIRAGQPHWSQRFLALSPQAKDFVQKLLVDASSRLSAKDALEHPFLRSKIVQEERFLEPGILRSLRKFARASAFRRALLSIVALSLSNEDRNLLHEQFLAMDREKRGTITMLEMKSVLEDNFHVDGAEAEALFSCLDTDNDDTIEYSEFLAAALIGRVQVHEDLLRKTFGRFDKSESGTITAENLRCVLGEHFGAEMEELIREADKSGHGQIDYDEFLAYFYRSDTDGLPQFLWQDASGLLGLGATDLLRAVGTGVAGSMGKAEGANREPCTNLAWSRMDVIEEEHFFHLVEKMCAAHKQEVQLLRDQIRYLHTPEGQKLFRDHHSLHDQHKHGAMEVFEVAELIFGIIFTAEVALKIFVEHLRFFREGWNWLDFIVVFVWLFGKTGQSLPVNSQILRLGRLFRLLRMLRLEFWMPVCLFHKLTMGFAVVGVINGVLMQETFKVAHMDDTVMQRAMRAHLAKMSLLFQEADTSGDGRLDLEEFKSILDDYEVKIWLAAMDLDVSDVEELFFMLDDGGDGRLSAEELVKGVAKLRGAARAMDLRKIHRLSSDLQEGLTAMAKSQEAKDLKKLGLLLLEY
eukprot:g12405.t1